MSEITCISKLSSRVHFRRLQCHQVGKQKHYDIGSRQQLLWLQLEHNENVQRSHCYSINNSSKVYQVYTRLKRRQLMEFHFAKVSVPDEDVHKSAYGSIQMCCSTFFSPRIGFLPYSRDIADSSDLCDNGWLVFGQYCIAWRQESHTASYNYMFIVYYDCPQLLWDFL